MVGVICERNRTELFFQILEHARDAVTTNLTGDSKLSQTARCGAPLVLYKSYRFVPSVCAHLRSEQDVSQSPLFPRVTGRCALGQELFMVVN